MAAVALLSPLLLFTPFPKYLGITPLVEQERSWITVAFLFSLCFLATYPLYWVGLEARDRMRRAAVRKRMRKYCEALTDDEKHVFEKFIQENRRTVILFHNANHEGTANHLIEVGLLKATPPPTNPPFGANHSWTIEAWLFEYLKKHP